MNIIRRMSLRQSKLDPFADKLTGWLKAEVGKLGKQRRTAKQLYEDLVKLGFEGSYSRVAAFAENELTNWRADRQHEQQTTGQGIFLRQVFRAGEAFQFDWSENYAVLAGERTKLQVAHIKLSPSLALTLRAFLIRAYLLQTHEMLFDAHCRQVYAASINLAAWLQSVRRPSRAPEFCNPAAGWDELRCAIMCKHNCSWSG